MPRYVLPLLLLALAACGLDEFDWGGAKNEVCAVRWEMRITKGPPGADRINPEITNVRTPGEGSVFWTASYQGVDPEPIVRDLKIVANYFEEQNVFAIPQNNEAFEFRVAGPCTYQEEDSDLRSVPLRRYVCELVGEYRGDEIAVQMTLREFDECI
jgi:hypothetical protein